MESKQTLTVQISTSVFHLPPSEPLRNTVVLGIDQITEDILLRPNGFQTLFRVTEFPVDYYGFDICCSDPDHIYDVLSNHLANPPVCQQLASMISSAVTGMGMGLQSISISVEARLNEERIFRPVPVPMEDPIFLPVPLSMERGASEDLLQRLAQERTLDVDGLEQLSSSSSETCTICLDDFSGSGKELMQLPCSHAFHRECVFEWLRRNNSCPMCRQVMIEEMR